MKQLQEIFDIKYGVNLELINCDIVDKGIPFVSRTEKNNGIAAFVEKIEGQNMNPAHSISVAVGGSVGSSFYHPYEYYSGRDVYILSPKNKMSVKEMLFYCMIIEKNKYRFNYGRQANKTLPYLLVPSKIPTNFNRIDFPSEPLTDSMVSKRIKLKTKEWKKFLYSNVFKIKRGKRLIKIDRISGSVPYFSASQFNNGCTDFIDNPIFIERDAIIYSSFGDAFYVEGKFTASDEISIFKNKNLNVYNGLFVSTIISQNKYRYSFGRKAFKKQFENDAFLLPVDKNGDPNWQFMEDYIKSLPCSASL